MKNNSSSGRFSAAALPGNLAPRHALLNVFHRTALRRLAVVSAPAGSGKTVTAQLWLRSAGRRPIWLPVTEALRSISDFYHALGAGLLSTQPGNAEAAAVLGDPDFAAAPVENILRFIAALRPDDEFYAVVFDDMHRIDDGEIWKSLPAVLKALPDSFVSLVLTRVDPPWFGGESKPTTAIPRIGGGPLAFTQEEIGGYFRANGLDLSESELAVAHAHTGGWAMGVRALAISGNMALGAGRELAGYIQTQVWEGWGNELRDCLLRLSVAEELSPELARRLSGRSDVVAVLDRLCADNAFVLRGRDGLYRFHHLFLDFLAERRAEGGVDERACQRLAAVYYRERGMQYEALRAFARAGDAEGVEACMFDLYRYSKRGASVAEHTNRLRAFLIDIVPDAELARMPYLLVNYIWYHFLTGDAAGMHRYLDRFYAEFDRILREHGQFHALGVLIAVLDTRPDRWNKPFELSRGLKEEAANRDAQTITVTENMPYFHRSHRDYTVAATDIECNIGAMHELCRPIFGEGVFILSHGVMAGLHYEKDNREAAGRYVEQVAAALPDAAPTELHFCVGLLQALLRRSEGDDDGYRQRMDTLEKRLQERGAALLPNFEATRAKYLLMDANKTTAEYWLSRYYVTETDRPEFHRLYQHFATARAHLVLGQVDAAEQWLARIRRLGTDFYRPLDVAEADALRAALAWATGRRKEAKEILRGALLSMQPYGFTRTIAEEGAAVLPILKQIVRDLPWEDTGTGLRDDYVHAVFTLAKKEAKRHKGVTWHVRDRDTALAPQQLMVLREIAAGRKLAEIAALHNLALPTVKGHASAVYRKLDVPNAKKAIAKARELGLLE